MALGGASPPPIWLMVGASELLDAAAPLVEHRRAEGFEVRTAKADIGAAIDACPRPPAFLLLLGDDRLKRPLADGISLPSKRGSLYRWRSVQPEAFAADPAWADRDGDGIPDFPVGRIPGQTVADIEVIVSKTIAHDTRDLSPADLALPIWGGTPAYGKLLDEGATSMLLGTVRKYAPHWSEPWLMFGNPRSPLSAHPPEQPSIFNNRLAAGGFVSAMIGHGGPTSFLSQTAPAERVDYLASHAKLLTGDIPTSPLIILACDCGSFAREQDSLAETLLFASGGPVNVVAATTESHPLTNYYSSLAVLGELDAGHERFGALWHAAQIEGFHTRKRFTERLLKNAEGALDAEINIGKLKRDQLLMYALLGDPATRLPVPRPLDVALERDGEFWHWDIPSPAPGSKIQVGVRRPSDPPRIKPEGSSKTESMKLFDLRNSAWRFDELAADWKGKTRGPGRLRIVVTAGREIYQFTRDLPK